MIKNASPTQKSSVFVDFGENHPFALLVHDKMDCILSLSGFKLRMASYTGGRSTRMLGAGSQQVFLPALVFSDAFWMSTLR